MSDFAPALPITTLEDALSLYRKWITPLLSKEELLSLEKVIADFKEKEGAEFAQRFSEYVGSLSENKNWMADFWTTMYLQTRDPLLTDSNYRLTMAPFNQEKGLRGDMFIGEWLLSTARFYLKSRLDTSKTYEAFNQKICNLNTKNLLGCARIPAKDSDIWEKYENETLDSIAVFYKDQIFILPIIDSYQQPYSAEKIASALSRIRKEHGHSLCNFTASSYPGSDTCYSFLESFLSHDDNQQSFDKLNKTLCHVLLLDEDHDASVEEKKEFLYATKYPHWCYKPMTFFMWNNERITVHMEHTGADGIVASHILDEIKKDFLSVPDSPETTQEISYHSLNWTYSPTEFIALQNWKKWYISKVDEFALHTYEFEVKSDLAKSIPRDALVHILLQYGMSYILDIPHSIYASCSMNHYREGRTEALRTVSTEIQNFVLDVKANKKINMQLLEDAIKEHKTRIKLSKTGMAPSRYLQGLVWLNKDSAKESPFFNSLYSKLGENYFSTSNIGALDDLMSYFYFSPPQPSHFGVGYLTGEDKVRLCMSYYEKNQDLLDKMLFAFNEFEQICENP